MSLPLLTALGTLQAVPCVVALIQGKDRTTRVLLGLTAAIAGIIALSPFDPISDLVTGTLLTVLACTAGVVGVLSGVRVGHKVVATLIIVSGLLLAAVGLGVVR